MGRFSHRGPRFRWGIRPPASSVPHGSDALYRAYAGLTVGRAWRELILRPHR